MDFITKNWTYAEQCARCRAIEIAEITGRFCDIEDFQQEILMWLIKQTASFDPERSKPSTYIAMISVTAKKRILRNLRYGQERILNDAIPIPNPAQ